MATGSDVNVSEVIKTVTRIVVDHNDLGLQCISAWMLGHLYLSACAVAENRSSGEFLCLYILTRFDNMNKDGRSVKEITGGLSISVASLEGISLHKSR